MIDFSIILGNLWSQPTEWFLQLMLLLFVFRNLAKVIYLWTNRTFLNENCKKKTFSVCKWHIIQLVLRSFTILLYPETYRSKSYFTVLLEKWKIDIFSHFSLANKLFSVHLNYLSFFAPQNTALLQKRFKFQKNVATLHDQTLQLKVLHQINPLGSLSPFPINFH